MAKSSRSTKLVGARGRRGVTFVLSNPWRAAWLGVFVVVVALVGYRAVQYSEAATIEEQAKTDCGAYGVRASVNTAQCIARDVLLPYYGLSKSQMGGSGSGLIALWNGESGWHWYATNTSSGAYGIPQSLPAWKMASVYCGHGDWTDDATCQMRWGIGYIKSVYGTPDHAYNVWLSRSPHWY
jgi:hypothetical protein